MQEFVEHGHSDIRAFVLGDQVIASMRRVATGWENQLQQGARPAPEQISKEYEEIAIKAAKAVGCKVAGVDILEGPMVHAL
jgi:ribosomal protein S6--L-glutamate ligase